MYSHESTYKEELDILHACSGKDIVCSGDCTSWDCRANEPCSTSFANDLRSACGDLRSAYASADSDLCNHATSGNATSTANFVLLCSSTSGVNDLCNANYANHIWHICRPRDFGDICYCYCAYSSRDSSIVRAASASGASSSFGQLRGNASSCIVAGNYYDHASENRDASEEDIEEGVEEGFEEEGQEEEGLPMLLIKSIFYARSAGHKQGVER